MGKRETKQLSVGPIPDNPIFPKWTITQAMKANNMGLAKVVSAPPSESVIASSKFLNYLRAVTGKSFLNARICPGGAIYIMNPNSIGGGGGGMWKKYVKLAGP